MNLAEIQEEFAKAWQVRKHSTPEEAARNEGFCQFYDWVESQEMHWDPWPEFVKARKIYKLEMSIKNLESNKSHDPGWYKLAGGDKYLAKLKRKLEKLS